MEEHDHSGGMASRGVTRPMSHDKSNEDHHDMDRGKMLHHHHHQTLWIYWTIILLGIWMVASPLTFSYGKDIVQPTFLTAKNLTHPIPFLRSQKTTPPLIRKNRCTSGGGLPGLSTIGLCTSF